MTKEELQLAEEVYSKRFINTKEYRAEIDSNFQKVLFNDGIIIKTLGDIIFYAIQERKETYYENGEIQTIVGKRRTIEDTYRIQKSYNIKCGLKDVKKAIDSLVGTNLLTYVFCKRTLVWTYSRENYNTTINQINDHLNNNNLNHNVREIIRKTRGTIKRKIKS